MSNLQDNKPNKPIETSSIENIEGAILSNFLNNPSYFSKVFTFFKPYHFNTIEHQEIFKVISEYYKDYQSTPTPKEIGISLKSITQEKLRDEVIKAYKILLTEPKILNQTYLINKSQEYVQKQEFKKAILEGAKAFQENKDLEPTYYALGEAMKINFAADTGLNYNNEKSLEDRFEYYKNKIFGIDTGIKSLDEKLGGFRPKTLNVIASKSHGGKSLFMAHCTSHMLMQGRNVLFITLEMSELEVAKRIDANVLDIDINTLDTVDMNEVKKKYDVIKDKMKNLYIKEYPAGSFDTLKLESLLNELLNEEKFTPDIIFIDYLTLMKSSRVNPSIGTYQYYKFISEELHGFAKQYELPIVTAAQLNRSGYGNMESGLEAVSDSLGIAMTADVFFSIIRSKELDEINQILVTFQKNRNTGNMNATNVGVEYSKMRYYDTDLDDTELDNLHTLPNQVDTGLDFDGFDISF